MYWLRVTASPETDGELHSEISLVVDGKETTKIHTSCSQPLAIGDVFGSLTIVGINGQDGGVDVTYQYVVTNNGAPVSSVEVTDDLLGYIGGPVDPDSWIKPSAEQAQALRHYPEAMLAFGQKAWFALDAEGAARYYRAVVTRDAGHDASDDEDEDRADDVARQ